MFALAILSSVPVLWDEVGPQRHSLRNIVGTVIARMMKWAGNVAGMVGMRRELKIVLRKFEGKRFRGRPIRR